MSAINGTEYVPKPKSHPRRSAEANAYALRVRDGTGNLFGTTDTQNGDVSPRGGVRLPTAEAKRNYDLNKGCMNEMMGGGVTNGTGRHPMVAKSGGFRTAESNKGEAMRNLMDKYGEMDLADRPIPKLKGQDAQHYADRNHGTMDILFHNYGNNENVPDPLSAQRLANGNIENAKKHHGNGMAPLLRMEGERITTPIKYSRLHMESKDASWDEIPPPLRLRPEGEVIQARYSNGAMKEIMGMNGNLKERRAFNCSFENNPAVKSPSASSNGERNANFLNGYNIIATPPNRGRVSPNRTRPEAVEYLNKNKICEVGAIMRGDLPPTTPSGRKTNRNLRSEEW